MPCWVIIINWLVVYITEAIQPQRTARYWDYRIRLRPAVAIRPAIRSRRFVEYLLMPMFNPGVE